ncbi:hypothetical protein F1880_008246 [Penicillium rolfsii]|nr:hypothetical protein F1880_008246 [Penicillium rolfsii]
MLYQIQRRTIKINRTHTVCQYPAKEQAAVVVTAAAPAAVPPRDCQPPALVSIFAGVVHNASRLVLEYLARSSVSFASCMKHTLERRDPGLAAY